MARQNFKTSGITIGDGNTVNTYVTSTTMSSGVPVILDSFTQANTTLGTMVEYDIFLRQGTQGATHTKLISSPSPATGQFSSSTVSTAVALREEHNGPYAWVTRTSNLSNSVFTTTNSIINKPGTNFWAISGSYGQVRTSTDTIIWVTRAVAQFVGTSSDRVYLTFGADTWVAGATQGRLVTSTDAITWTTRTSTLTSAQNHIALAFLNNTFLLGGNLGQIGSSTDAITWVTRTSNFASTPVTGFAHNGSVFLATSVNAIATSTDAVTWVTRNAGTSQRLSSCDFGQGKFVAVGYYGVGRQSTDGITWTTANLNYATITVSDGAEMVRYDSTANIWVAVGGRYETIGAGRLSTDGNTWVTMSISNLNQNVTRGVNSIGIGSSGWLVGGQFGLVRFAPRTNFAAAIPATISAVPTVAWTTRLISNAGGPFSGVNINTIAYGAGIFVAGGQSGRVASSTDGITWTTRTANIANNEFVWDIDFGNGIWVLGTASGNIRTSTDAITWVTRTSNFGTTAVRNVRFLNNLWIATGYAGQARYSTDAITWATATIGAAGGSFALDSTDFGNGLYAGGGNQGVFASSTDGITWTTRNISPGGAINTMLFARNQWLMTSGSADGRISSSTDTITWVSVGLTRSSIDLADVKYADNMYVGVGANGFSALSTDGVSWITATIDARNGIWQMQEVAYHPILQRWCAVGSGPFAATMDKSSWGARLQVNVPNSVFTTTSVSMTRRVFTP